MRRHAILAIVILLVLLLVLALLFWPGREPTAMNDNQGPVAPPASQTGTSPVSGTEITAIGQTATDFGLVGPVTSVDGGQPTDAELVERFQAIRLRWLGEEGKEIEVEHSDKPRCIVVGDPQLTFSMTIHPDGYDVLQINWSPYGLGKAFGPPEGTPPVSEPERTQYAGMIEEAAVRSMKMSIGDDLRLDNVFKWRDEDKTFLRAECQMMFNGYPLTLWPVSLTADVGNGGLRLIKYNTQAYGRTALRPLPVPTTWVSETEAVAAAVRALAEYRAKNAAERDVGEIVPPSVYYLVKRRKGSGIDKEYSPLHDYFFDERMTPGDFERPRILCLVYRVRLLAYYETQDMETVLNEHSPYSPAIYDICIRCDDGTIVGGGLLPFEQRDEYDFVPLESPR